MEVVGGLVIVHAAVGFFANRRPLFARGNGVSSTNLKKEYMYTQNDYQ